MGLVKKKGFNYPDDIHIIKEEPDAFGAITLMTAQDFVRFKYPTKFGLPFIKDQRITWLERACHNYQNLRKIDHFNRHRPSVRKEQMISETGKYLDIFINEDTNKKVCGSLLKGAPEGYLCLKDAGAGTSHRGWGRCHIHEREQDSMEQVRFWEFLRSVNKARNLGDIAKQAQELAPYEAEFKADIDYLIWVRQIIIENIKATAEAVEKPFVSNKDASLLKDITLAIANIKKSKHFVESRGMVPVSQIGTIITQVLELVTQGEEDAVKLRIANRAASIRGDLLLPVLEEDARALPEPNQERQRIMGSILNKIKTVARGSENWNDIAPVTLETKKGKDGQLRYFEVGEQG